MIPVTRNREKPFTRGDETSRSQGGRQSFGLGTSDMKSTSDESIKDQMDQGSLIPLRFGVFVVFHAFRSGARWSLCDGHVTGVKKMFFEPITQNWYNNLSIYD